MREIGARLLATALLIMPATVACRGGSDSPPVAVAGLARVVPAPVEARPTPGVEFALVGETVVHAAGDARRVGEQLAALLRPATGFPLPVRETAAPGAVSLLLDGADERVGEQGYQLDVGSDGITLRARTAAGLFAGVQTLRQLLPAAIESDTAQQRAWTVPGGRIVDFPRFAYRGAMLDLARHFHSPDEVKEYIDQIAQYKINHLHLHLTDDQGWRIEITKWPELTTRAGGPGTGVAGAGPGFLTQQQYADLVRYAAERFVTVVPEIDLPGHTNAAMATYPQLTCDGVAPKPRTDTEVGYSSLCVGKEETYTFVEDVIREVAALTPGPYLHIGGDEAKATTDEEYRTFMDRVLPLPGRYGKTAVGWHEVAAVAGAGVVAQYWGTESTAATVPAAVGRGARVLMSPANRAYLDQKYTRATPLGLDWAALIEVRDAYEWDPAGRLPGVGEQAVLGVEAPLWSETLRTLDDVEFMAFPRLPAIAEVGWSSQGGRDWADFRLRLAGQAPRWTLQGINFYRSPQVAWVS